MLDFTGGILSDLQLVLDCINLKDFKGITGNPAKFGLGWLSIVFDLIFMTQHYCLYSPRTVDNSGETMRNDQNEPLLAAADSEESNVTSGFTEEEGGNPPEPSQPQTIFV